MLTAHPHLRESEDQFWQENHCHRIVYEYLIDESIKFRYIHDAYLKRVKELEEFRRENKETEKYNKKQSSKKKQKKYLELPKDPVRPQHRFFRNFDILKSMMRGWFELEYKKYIKKNKPWF